MLRRRRRFAPLRSGGGDQFTALFDQGSAASIALDGEDQRITTIQHWDSKWAWFAIRGRKMTGLTPSFVTAKANHYNLVADMHLAMYATAADSDTWTDFDNVTIGDSDIEFYNDGAFNANTIYISALPMYPFSRTQRKMVEWLVSDLTSDTTSGTNGVVFTTTSRDSNDGRSITVPALPLYGFKISSGAGTKNAVVLTGYSHPSETPGVFALEGALDWLLTSGSLQSFLLDYCDFYVYPCINPQGVWAGFFRSCPQGPTYDHNRKYNDGTSGVLEEVDALKTIIAADCASVEASFDFHSYMSAALRFGNVIDEDDATHIAFMNSVKLFDAGFSISTSAVSDGLKDWLSDTFSPTIVMAPEHGHAAASDVDDYKDYGENILKGLTYFIAAGRTTQGPGVGSRDFNGSTDRLDWANVMNPAGGAITISFWVNPDSVATNQYMICLGKSDNTSGILINLTGSTVLQFLRTGSTSLYRVGANPLSTGSWQHVLATHDGTYGDYTTINIYKNGAEISYSGGQNGATETAITGLWAIGGRPSADDRCFNGKIAQVGVWNRVLGSTEIANLAAGYAPNLAAASGLQFYWPGNTESLEDLITETSATADGTSQVTGAGNGPAIIYGQGQTFSLARPVCAVFDSIPLVSVFGRRLPLCSRWTWERIVKPIKARRQA